MNPAYAIVIVLTAMIALQGTGHAFSADQAIRGTISLMVLCGVAPALCLVQCLCFLRYLRLGDLTLPQAYWLHRHLCLPPQAVWAGCAVVAAINIGPLFPRLVHEVMARWAAEMSAHLQRDVTQWINLIPLEVLWLIPWSVSLVAVWAISDWTGSRLSRHSDLAGADNRSSRADGQAIERRGPPAPLSNSCWLRVKWYLLLFLGPVVLLWIAREVSFTRLGDAVENSLGNCGTWWASLLGGSLLLLGLVAALPSIVRIVNTQQIVSGQALPARLAQMATYLATINSATPHLWYWHTSSRITTIFLLGAIPGTQRIVVSDGLLQRLCDQQLRALLRHEIAHARSYHPSLRLAILVIPTLLLAFAAGIGAHAGYAQPSETLISTATAPVSMIVAMIGWLWWIVLGCSRIQHYTEHAADIKACKMAESNHQPEIASSSALQTQLYDPVGDLCSAIEKCSDPHPGWLGRWSHPTVQQRVQILQAYADRQQCATREEAAGAVLRGEQRRIGQDLCCLAAVVVIVWVLRLSGI